MSRLIFAILLSFLSISTFLISCSHSEKSFENIYDYTDLSGIPEETQLKILYSTSRSGSKWIIANDSEELLFHDGGGDIEFVDHISGDFSGDGLIDIAFLARIHYGSPVWYTFFISNYKGDMEIVSIKLGIDEKSDYVFGDDLNGWRLPSIRAVRKDRSTIE